MEGDLSDAAKVDAGQVRAAQAPLDALCRRSRVVRDFHTFDGYPWAVSPNVQIEFLNTVDQLGTQNSQQSGRIKATFEGTASSD